MSTFNRMHIHRSCVTTVSQLKMCDFSGEIFKGFEVLKFSMSATTTQPLSSGEFCKLRYDIVPLKSASANVSFSTNNSKMPILNCDTLVANERYVCMYVCRYVFMYVCVCMYVCVFVCMYVCMYVCVCVCMYVCIYVCIYVQLHSITQLLIK